jgi:two-component system response regulator YesN
MYNILLVDDEPMIKLGIRKLLTDTKYTIVGTANNGMEALTLLKITPVDIILTDLKMPVMDGIELIRQLKSENFQGVILVLSNYSDFDLVRNALTEGASDYLLKNNIIREHLLEHLDKIFEELNSRLKNVKRENELLKSKRQFLLSEWQSYLNDNTELSEDALRLLQTKSLKNMEYNLFLISIEDSNLTSQRKKHLITQIKELLPDIFGISEHTLILQTGSFELFCLIPVAACALSTTSLNLTIQRRIHMYFNIVPLISHVESVKGPEKIQKKYQECSSALRYHFYYPDRFLFPVSEYGSFQKGNITLESDFRNKISDSCKQNNKTLMIEASQNFINVCCHNHIDPDWVLETFYTFAKQTLFMPNSNNVTPEKLTLIKTLKESRTHLSLLEASVPLFVPESENTAPDNTMNASKKEIQNVISFIISHYAESITLEEIAEHVNLNRNYLCRLFKQQTGNSIWEYLNQFRMEKGAQYIRENKEGYTIKDIASRVGIDDPFYFTRKFKSYFGKSPTEYGKTAE